jgi:hypothetical protein
MKTQELTFHIVYVPRSVSYLLAFVDSLLQWSDCSFRLVSNGCDKDENEFMQAFCRRSSRLDFLALPTARPLAHQDALNYLQAGADTETFCFLDSDIFAVGPFMDGIDARFSANTAIFGGAPFWLRPEDQQMSPEVNIACGEHNRTHTDLPLGSSFLAVYDARTLAAFIRTTGVGFEIRDWPELPAGMQDWCAGHGMRGYWFDTGKVLNLGLQQQGHAIEVVDTPNLVHLGGLSFIAKRRWYDAQKSQRWLRSALYFQIREVYIQLRRRIRNEPVFRSARLPFLARRRRYGPYFADLLEALVIGQQPPHLPPEDDPGIRAQALAATRQITLLMRDYLAQHSPLPLQSRDRRGL